MHNRREFLKGLSGAAAGIVFTGCGLVDSALAMMQAGGAKRREVLVGARRVLTVDVHSHIAVPEALDLVKDYPETESFRNALRGPSGPANDIHSVAMRLERMDRQGTDVQAVSINPFWYFAPPELARRIIQVSNEKIAELCAAHPTRFVGLAAIALQHPELAAEQLEEAVKKMGLRGCLIGGSVNGEELSAPKFHPFWAMAEQLQALVFLHPQTNPDPLIAIRSRFLGNGLLTNVIGHPLETTIAITHLIQDGTLDLFPKLKFCGAHGGGYLPSYSGRSDACLTAFPEDCKPLRKLPGEYLKQLYFDSLTGSTEGLRHLVATVGASQVVLGTDFPTMWNDHGIDQVLATPELSDADKRAILGGNAAKLLRINLQPGKPS
jgi:predicted TIM-barrel fold metal-dependent hydrolase